MRSGLYTLLLLFFYYYCIKKTYLLYVVRIILCIDCKFLKKTKKQYVGIMLAEQKSPVEYTRLAIQNGSIGPRRVLLPARE